MPQIEDIAYATAVAPESANVPSTGTVDDDDEPEDESDQENEAEVGERSDSTEAPEEFKRDDEDPE